ncbi:MAG: BrnT family toxin [Rickettsiales bacterium]
MPKKLSYDPTKRDRTIKERGLDFEQAAEVFAGNHFDFEDLRINYGEKRTITVGFLNQRMIIVVWTPRKKKRHIISMRKANEREKKQYQEIAQKSLG